MEVFSNQVFSQRLSPSAPPGGLIRIILCLFTGIKSDLAGGCFFVSSKLNLTIESCIIRDCSSKSVGGALYIDQNSGFSISNNCFSQCQALNCQTGYLMLDSNKYGIFADSSISDCNENLYGEHSILHIYSGISDFSHNNISRTYLRDYDVVNLRYGTNSNVDFCSIIRNIATLVVEHWHMPGRTFMTNIVNNSEPKVNYALFLSNTAAKAEKCAIIDNKYQSLIRHTVTIIDCVFYQNSFATSSQSFATSLSLSHYKCDEKVSTKPRNNMNMLIVLLCNSLL